MATWLNTVSILWFCAHGWLWFTLTSIPFGDRTEEATWAGMLAPGREGRKGKSLRWLHLCGGHRLISHRRQSYGAGGGDRTFLVDPRDKKKSESNHPRDPTSKKNSTCKKESYLHGVDTKPNLGELGVILEPIFSHHWKKYTTIATITYL